jgi:hypothetical protein
MRAVTAVGIIVPRTKEKGQKMRNFFDESENAKIGLKIASNFVKIWL